MLDGHAGSAVKVSVSIQYSVVVARSGYKSGIKGSVTKVEKSFICTGCLNPVTSAGRTSVDIGASAKLQRVSR